MIRTHSAAVLFVVLLLSGCAATRHLVQPSALGVARPEAKLEEVASLPGPIELETVNASEWAVRSRSLEV